MPDEGCVEQGDVILLSAEDGAANIVLRRLQAQHADLNRIHNLTFGRQNEPEYDLQAHLLRLEKLVFEKEASLVVIDPVMAYTGKVDTHRDSEVRKILSRISSMAERTGVAVVGVMHLTKNDRANPTYRVGGSVGFYAAARSVLAVSIHPENPGSRILAGLKGNLSILPDSLEFHIDSSYSQPILVWDGVVDFDAATLLGQRARDGNSKLEQASLFLTAFLQDGPHSVGAISDAAKVVGFSSRTLERAKKCLDIESNKRGVPGMQGGGAWYWELPK